MPVTLVSAQEDLLAPGQRRPLFRGSLPPPCHGLRFLAVEETVPCVGARFIHPELGPVLQVLSRFRWPAADLDPCREGCWVEALGDVHVSPRGLRLGLSREGAALAWVTMSDKGYAGQRPDAAGPLIAQLVAKTLPLCLSQGFLLPDDPGRLRALLTDLALEQGFDLIVTTGGTGVGPRDLTPETSVSVLEKRLPGMETAMLMASLAKTSHAVISRAVAGVLGKSVIINLPGSPKAVAENLEALLPSLAHALAKLQGDPTDCAAPFPEP